MHFRGDYFFLSNFFPVKIRYMDIEWPTVENAYQAMKAPRREWERIAQMKPGEAKRFCRQYEPLSNREDIMFILLKLKFAHPWLKSKLEAVREEIVEENLWHDNYWGVCRCKRYCGAGVNVLGKMLMAVRDKTDWRSL